ncbi:unnamed protein product [Cylicocyclus nassatus]|uniref:STPR domain-containing protein n=1 Tax=Cylicocyclus nassatus TaxID=53992 RepID=A0AA36DMQ4_CYLNA|nr:unnamed protein product [Cylicocyclus nassatus]
MHEAPAKSNNIAFKSDAAKAQLMLDLEQQPCCSRQNLSLSNETVEQPHEQPLPEETLPEKSLETAKEHTQRKKVERVPSGSNKIADEHKLARLEFNAERCRSKRWLETEQQRAERLAKVAERAKLRRSTETEEQRLLRLRTSADRKRRRVHNSSENEICEGSKRSFTSCGKRSGKQTTVSTCF